MNLLLGKPSPEEEKQDFTWGRPPPLIKKKLCPNFTTLPSWQGCQNNSVLNESLPNTIFCILCILWPFWFPLVHVHFFYCDLAEIAPCIPTCTAGSQVGKIQKNYKLIKFTESLVYLWWGSFPPPKLMFFYTSWNGVGVEGSNWYINIILPIVSHMTVFTICSHKSKFVEAYVIFPVFLSVMFVQL